MKKLIYVIEKDKGALQSSPDEELAATDQTPLLNNHRYAVDNVMEASNRRFLDALNKALNNIVAFYSRKETELYDDMDQLLFDYDRLNTLHAHDSLTLATQPSAIPSPEHKRHSTALQKRTVDLFVMLSELKTYVTLNHTAFSKILKKYDKITDNVLKPYYLTSYVDCAFPFKATTRARLDERIQETEHGYVLLVTTDDVTEEFAMAELKMHLREHVIWERNTVWRDLVALERKKQTVELAAQRTWGYWQWFHGFFLAAALLVFALLLSVDLFGQVEQNRCFAILVFISMLWAGKVSLGERARGADTFGLFLGHATVCNSFDDPIPGSDVTGFAFGRWIPIRCPSSYSISVCSHVFPRPHAPSGCLHSDCGAQQVWDYKDRGGVCSVSNGDETKPGLVGAYVRGYSYKHVDQQRGCPYPLLLLDSSKQ